MSLILNQKLYLEFLNDEMLFRVSKDQRSCNYINTNEKTKPLATTPTPPPILQFMRRHQNHR